MLIKRSKHVLKTIRKAGRDAGIGLLVYSGIAILALEDRAQAGSATLVLPDFGSSSAILTGPQPPLLTLVGLGILFSLLVAFTLTVFRHFGKTFVLARVHNTRSLQRSN